MSKIKTVEDNIKIKVEVTVGYAGALDTSSKKTAIEYGEVVEIGPDVTLPVKVGDKLFFKAWGCDIISHNGKDYTYVAQRTGAIKEINPKFRV